MVSRGVKSAAGVSRLCAGWVTDLESGGDVKVLLHVGAQHLAHCGGPQLALELVIWGSRIHHALHITTILDRLQHDSNY